MLCGTTVVAFQLCVSSVRGWAHVDVQVEEKLTPTHATRVTPWHGMAWQTACIWHGASIFMPCKDGPCLMPIPSAVIPTWSLLCWLL